MKGVPVFLASCLAALPAAAQATGPLALLEGAGLSVTAGTRTTLPDGGLRVTDLRIEATSGLIEAAEAEFRKAEGAWSFAARDLGAGSLRSGSVVGASHAAGLELGDLRFLPYLMADPAVLQRACAQMRPGGARLATRLRAERLVSARGEGGEARIPADRLAIDSLVADITADPATACLEIQGAALDGLSADMAGGARVTVGAVTYLGSESSWRLEASTLASSAPQASIAADRLRITASDTRIAAHAGGVALASPAGEIRMPTAALEVEDSGGRFALDLLGSGASAPRIEIRALSGGAPASRALGDAAFANPLFASLLGARIEHLHAEITPARAAQVLIDVLDLGQAAGELASLWPEQERTRFLEALPPGLRSGSTGVVLRLAPEVPVSLVGLLSEVLRDAEAAARKNRLSLTPR